MLQPAVRDTSFGARALDVGEEPRERGGQLRTTRLLDAEHGTMLQPRLDVEALALAPARKRLDDGTARHEQDGEHTDPKQRHDREAQHLAESEQSVFECAEQIHRLFHNVYAPPSSTLTTTSAPSHGPTCGPAAAKGSAFSASDERQPSTTSGATASSSANDATITSPSSRSSSDTNSRRSCAKATAAATTNPAANAAGSHGSPWTCRTEIQAAPATPAASGGSSHQFGRANRVTAAAMRQKPSVVTSNEPSATKAKAAAANAPSSARSATRLRAHCAANTAAARAANIPAACNSTGANFRARVG